MLAVEWILEGSWWSGPEAFVRTGSGGQPGEPVQVRRTGGQPDELVGSQVSRCKSGEPVQASDDPLHRQHGGDEPH